MAATTAKCASSYLLVSRASHALSVAKLAVMFLFIFKKKGMYTTVCTQYLVKSIGGDCSNKRCVSSDMCK